MSGQSKSSEFTQTACLGLLIVMVALMIAVGAMLHIHRPTAAFLLKENGPFELIGFAACIISVPFFLKAAQKYRAESPLKALWLCALALGFFFIGMEEVSWGQSFFGWQTPDGVANVQHETNLHNMPFIHYYAHYLGITLLAVYFVIIPLSYHGISVLRLLLARIALPIVDQAIATLFAACFIFFQVLFSANYRLSVGEPINYGEMQEFIYQLCAALFAYECYRKARKDAR